MKFKAIFIDTTRGDIVLGEFETKEEAQQAIDDHAHKSTVMIRVYNPMAAFAYSGEYRIDEEEKK